MGLPASAAEEGGLKLRNGLKWNMLPRELSDREKLEMAKRCGFDGIDGQIWSLEESVEKAKLAREIGVPFHGIVFGTGNTLLSSPHDSIVKRGLEGMRHAIRCAKAMEVDTVLLVPARVDEKVSYDYAYKRSQENVAKLAPYAEEMQITIGIENVWNKFLLSPLEFARYLDEIGSERVRAYFDIGNNIIQGYAQHWVRILGKRIVKLDCKDFRRKGFEFVGLGDGDVNWNETLAALEEIGYSGWWTAEVKGGDEAYLKDVYARMEKIKTDYRSSKS